MGGIIGEIGDWINGVFEKILSILPDSPFQAISVIPEVQQVLGHLNYVLPISFALSLLQAWLVAVGIFYIWSILLRWIQAIE